MKRAFLVLVIVVCILSLVALWFPKKPVDSSSGLDRMGYDASEQSETWRDFTIKEVGVDTE